MATKLFPVIFITVLFACSAQGQVENVVVGPQGDFVSIDVASQNAIYKKLMALNEGSISAVIASPASYNPPVLYALSYALSELGREEEAAYWFYLGQLKARSDANKSFDQSAKQAVMVLNSKFGPQINKYTFKDIATLEATVRRAVESDQNMQRNYDPRWILLHGMDAQLATSLSFEAESRWEAINSSTRKKYFQDFEAAMKTLK